MAELTRLSSAAILAEWLRGLPSLIAMLLVVVVTTVQPGVPFVDWLRGAAVVLMVVRLLVPVYQWATTRFTVGARGVEVVKGILGSRRDALAWRDISVVEAEQPWSYRIWGLSITTLRPTGDFESHVTLDGVGAGTLGRLRASVEGARAAALESEARGNDPLPIEPYSGPPERPNSARGEGTYRASARDLVVTCGAQGRLLVIALGVAYAGYDLLLQFGAADSAFTWIRDHMVVSTLIIGVMVAAGAIASVIIRYGGLILRRRTDALELQHGLLDRTVRVVANDALVGVAIRRNLIEMISDRVRVSLVTSDGVGGLGQNLVLPSIPRRTAREALALLGVDLVDFDALGSNGLTSAPRAAGILAITAGVAVAVWTGAMTLTETVWLSLFVVLVALAIGLGGARIISTRFRVSSSIVVVRRDLAVDYEERVRSDGVHLLRQISAPLLPVRLVRLSYFAGLPRRRSGLMRNDEVFVAITEAMEATAARRTMSPWSSVRQTEGSE